MDKERRTILGYIFLVLFVGYLTCISLFMHVHYVDGVAVVHTHPMCHHHGHSHSAGDYFALGEYTSFTSLLPISFNLSLVLLTKQLTFDTACDSHIDKLYTSNLLLRAPPIV